MNTDDNGYRYDHGDQWSACTITGVYHEGNADAMALEFGPLCLGLAVADGVGLLPGSPAASRAAVGAAIDWTVKRRQSEDIDALFEYVNSGVAESLQHQEGATTLVAALIAGGQGLVASIGDSEALAVFENGPAEPLHPIDHMPNRPNVLLAWIDGQAAFDPHLVPLVQLPHRLCLVSDGVTGFRPSDQIATVVRSVAPSEAALALVQAARTAGSTDDITAIVISDLVEAETDRRGFRS
jgi:serine/threonine protein phosphatase PrpC